MELIKKAVETDETGPKSPYCASRDNCRRVQLPVYSGVYFLLLGPTVVYVGQSKNIAHRVAAHYADHDKKFDAVEVMSVPEELLDSVEAYWIEELHPRYNRFVALPKTKLLEIERIGYSTKQGNPHWLTIPAAIAYTGLSRSSLYKLLRTGQIPSVMMSAQGKRPHGIRVINRLAIDALFSTL